MRNKIFVLVAGSGSTTGINVIKALQKENISLVGCDCDKHNPSNLFCKSILVPRCSDADYMVAISKIIDEYNVTHIIPCNDHDLRKLTDNMTFLQSKNVFLNGFSDNTLNLLDKRTTLNLFETNEIDTPQEISDLTDFPYVLRKEKMGDNKKFVHIILNTDDLSSVPSDHHTMGMKTRFVEGIEYTVDVVCDDNYMPLSIIPRQRIIVVNGMVHHAKIIKDDILIEKTKDLCLKLKLTGMACIQCIKTLDNRYLFIEVNPRPGSGIDLSINGGVNMPYVWIQQTTGHTIRIQEPNWGLNLKRFSDGYFYKEDQ